MIPKRLMIFTQNVIVFFTHLAYCSGRPERLPNKLVKNIIIVPFPEQKKGKAQMNTEQYTTEQLNDYMITACNEVNSRSARQAMKPAAVVLEFDKNRKMKG